MTPITWWRLALHAAPYAVVAALLAALLVTRATLAEVRADARVATAQAAQHTAEANAAAEHRASVAADTYATRTAALQPIILRSRDTVTTYAQTPAGRATCLGADRVRGLDELDAALFPPAATNGRAGAVPADAGPAPVGRDGRQR